MKKWVNALQNEIKSRIDPALIRRVDETPRHHINEFGTDPFGYDPELIKLILPVARWFYDVYFRCEAHGLNRIPEGRVMLIANHSGQLPFDAMMLGTSLLLEAPKPRLVRGMVERWSTDLPFISTLFNRAGQLVGSPAIGKRILEMNEALMVFPEGAKGISKLYKDRYKLETFGHGFMRLALATNTPIIPIALVGAEEQAPAVADIKPLAKLLGFPAFPLIAPQIIPLPLPVKYYIHFGEPMNFGGDGTEDDEVVSQYVNEVKETIQHMLHVGLEKRPSIF
jgi:1-acyl-sn-glycerol-3-phosphate acyltransferase